MFPQQIGDKKERKYSVLFKIINFQLFHILLIIRKCGSGLKWKKI